MAAVLAYGDRFGHQWQVRASRVVDGWSLVFVLGEARLIAPEPVAQHPSTLSQPQLKELFCDAERVLVVAGDTWFVGYRQRAGGRPGQAQGGLCTRFRSESGELRYSRLMLDFRHMAPAALREHLAGAGRSAGHVTRAS